MIVGAYEAKTHLSELLERVARGEHITITKHGVPVAVLQPPGPAPRTDVLQTIAALRGLRKERQAQGAAVDQAELREWIEEGRE